MRGKILNFTVLIEKDEEGMYIAKVPDIPGCYTQGKTVEQAMERIVEAVQVCFEAEAIDGDVHEVRPEYLKKLEKIEKAGKFHRFKDIGELRKMIETSE